MIANTPEPPHYAVIFTTVVHEDLSGYEVMAKRMEFLAQQQPGFLGIDSARSEIGITVSYWKTLEAITAWKHHVEHIKAKTLGRKKWYKTYNLQISRVERAYKF